VLVEKFFDYLEANAEDYFTVPRMDLGRERRADEGTGGDEGEEKNLYEAAYEAVTYRDSSDDDFEGSVKDEGPVAAEFDLETAAGSLESRLRFLSTLTRLWRIAARASLADCGWRMADGGLSARIDPAPGAAEPTQQADSNPQSAIRHPQSVRTEALQNWLRQARTLLEGFPAFLEALHRHAIPEPLGSHDSLVEYDHRRNLKDRLQYAGVAAWVDTYSVVLGLQATLGPAAAPDPPAGAAGSPLSRSWEPLLIRLELALLRGEVEGVRATLPAFLADFQAEPLWFVPFAEGGTPADIVRTRIAHGILRALVGSLPRLGLLRETYGVLRTARAMELAHPPPGRWVSEFRDLFVTAYHAVLEALVDSAGTWAAHENDDRSLVRLLAELNEPFLRLWIDFCRSGQLSTLETLRSDAEWQALTTFTQRYGPDLFSTRFLTLGNLRSVLHRGLGSYLDYLREHADPLQPIRLIEDLDAGRVARAEAIRFLEIILRAVVENYEEYRDYTTTTTQSDDGGNLYLLLLFLRLKNECQRCAWQFVPLGMVHEVLARQGRGSAAVLWQEEFVRMTQDIADALLERLARLEQAHGMKLRTVADLLQERFVKAWAVDRLCALVVPVMEAAGQPDAAAVFARFEQELQPHTATPSGAGLDVPHWLRRLAQQVQRYRTSRTTVAELAEQHFHMPRRTISCAELMQQLQDWEKPLA
jgi:hypothetical protein